MSTQRKIFEGQTNITIFVESDMNLSNTKKVDIKYRKPDGQTGSWVAKVHDPLNGIVSYDNLQPDDLIPGTWRVWLKITMNSGKISIGSTDTFKVYEEGSL